MNMFIYINNNLIYDNKHHLSYYYDERKNAEY